MIEVNKNTNIDIMEFEGDFWKLLLSRYGVLWLKLAGSSKYFFLLLSKVFGTLILLKLESGVEIVTLFAIMSIYDLTVLGLMEFEKVKLNANIGGR